jgi:hypothetical protein
MDLSAVYILGTSWNVYQGFKVLGFFSIQSGEETDIYGWNRMGDISFTVGSEFKF